MNLMKNESLIIESSDNNLTLTTHRIRYQAESLGKVEIKSIMLEELTSCSLSRSAFIPFLLLGILSFILGLIINVLIPNTLWALILGIILALGFSIAYFLSREQSLLFTSPGISIKINTEKMNAETAKSFIDKVETAKNERYLILK